jgi:hypothetical protein
MITIEQMRRGRRRDVKAGRFGFTVELPTETRLFQLVGGETDNFLANARLVKACVIGWKDVRECDLVPAGAEDEVQFQRAIFEEWIEDRPDLWDPIVAAVFEIRAMRQSEREADAKN